MLDKIVNDTADISVITKIEVLRFNPAGENYSVLEGFIGDCNTINLNDPIVGKTIEVCKLSKIKLPDAIIAATALLHNMILVTRNTDDFKKIKGLSLFNPWQK